MCTQFKMAVPDREASSSGQWQTDSSFVQVKMWKTLDAKVKKGNDYILRDMLSIEEVNKLNQIMQKQLCKSQCCYQSDTCMRRLIVLLHFHF